MKTDRQLSVLVDKGANVKKILSILTLFCFIISLAACRQSEPDEVTKPYASAPMIVINGSEYFADTTSIVNELPDGYEYGGELTEEQMNLPGASPQAPSLSSEFLRIPRTLRYLPPVLASQSRERGITN